MTPVSNIRVLFDTNILLRMAAGGRHSQLMQLWRESRFTVVMSLATLTELQTVFQRPKIQQYVSTSLSSAFINLVLQRSEFVQPDLSAPTCRDPRDTSLIATAVGGKVTHLVTADPDLLDDPTLIEQLALRQMKVVNGASFVAEIQPD